MAREIISSKMTGFDLDIFLIAKQYAYFCVRTESQVTVSNKIAIRIGRKKTLRCSSRESRIFELCFSIGHADSGWVDDDEFSRGSLSSPSFVSPADHGLLG